jgi:hypothetical protein
VILNFADVRTVRVPTAHWSGHKGQRVTRNDDSGAKSADGQLGGSQRREGDPTSGSWGFPNWAGDPTRQVEHLFKTAHQAGFWIEISFRSVSAKRRRCQHVEFAVRQANANSKNITIYTRIGKPYGTSILALGLVKLALNSRSIINTIDRT